MSEAIAALAKFDPDSIHISAQVFVSACGSRVNLYSVFHYLPLDDEVLGMRWNNWTRGVYKRKGSVVEGRQFITKFPNQLSLRVIPKIMGLSVERNNINVKIFQNGQFQITGCSSHAMCDAVCQFVTEKLKAVRGLDDVPVEFDHGLLINQQSGQIYAHDGRAIGWKRRDGKLFEFLHGYEFAPETQEFLEITDPFNPNDFASESFSEDGIRYIYARDGKIIAEQRLLPELENVDSDQWKIENAVKKRTFVYISKLDLPKPKRIKAFLKQNDLTGELEILNKQPNDYNQDSVKRIGRSKTTWLPDACRKLPDYSQIKSVHTNIDALLQPESINVMPSRMVMINGNVKLPCRIKIRQMAEQFRQRGLNVIFNSEVGNKLQIKFNPRGRCICRKNTCKCEVSIIVFFGGSVMISANKPPFVRDAMDLVLNLINECPEIVIPANAPRPRKCPEPL